MLNNFIWFSIIQECYVITIFPSVVMTLFAQLILVKLVFRFSLNAFYVNI